MINLNVDICTITIGLVPVKIKEHFSSIKYDIITDSLIGNTIEITLFDDTDYIESLLLLSNREFTVEFPNRPPIRFSLMDVSPTYGQISQITFTGSSVGGARGDLRTRNFEGKKISDIAKDIISDNENWTLGDIEETEELLDAEGEIQTFTQSGETDYEFLNRISKYAQSLKTGNFGYRVITEDSVYNPRVSFKPDTVEEEILTLRFSIGDVQNAKDAKVISYSPELSLISNAIIFSDENVADKPESDVQTLEPNVPEKEGLTTVVGDNTDYTKNMTNTLNEVTSKLPFTASMELHGVHWDVYPTKVISVYAYRPNGKLHYSSGRYYVMSTTVNVNSGVFTQTVDMYRSGSFFEVAGSLLSGIAKL